MLEEFIPFIGLIIFGNIENLVLSSQGGVAGVNPRILGGLSIIIVILWLIVGTVCINMLMPYADIIEFVGGLAIYILGLESMISAVRGK